MKNSIRFVHASDLHLDAVFPGLSKEVPTELAMQLHNATFVTFNRLIQFCIDSQPDFLLLSGDIYNEEDHSIHAPLTLRDGCLTLKQAGIHVFIVHGNHDPYSSRMKSITWPENVTIFGTEVTNVPFTAPDGTLLARIYGISHATNRESKNLASQFIKTDDTCLHIAMLHCTIGREHQTDKYAPCSSKDLIASGMDYWALGHVHDYQEVLQHPLAIYPGCIQGLHINEQGEKGCVLIEATPHGSGYTFHKQFYPLATVLWHTLDICLDEVANSISSEDSPKELSLDSIENIFYDLLDSFVENLSPGWETVIIRLSLRGCTPLDPILRQHNNLDELLERLRQPATHTYSFWIKDITLLTTPPICEQDLLTREDLLGETIRLSKAISISDENLNQIKQEALSPLFSHHKLRKLIQYPNKDECNQLLKEATFLCIELLEND